MPVTVRGTDIRFNDGTTQSTASGNAQVNTTSVLNATAGASYGAVGTYVFARRAATGQIAPGSTIAGSGLNAAVVGMPTYGGLNYGMAAVLSGTWRAMGGNTTTLDGPAMIWLRIS